MVMAKEDKLKEAQELIAKKNDERRARVQQAFAKALEEENARLDINNQLVGNQIQSNIVILLND
jgi:hypothetical protein